MIDLPRPTPVNLDVARERRPQSEIEAMAQRAAPMPGGGSMIEQAIDTYKELQQDNRIMIDEIHALTVERDTLLDINNRLQAENDRLTGKLEETSFKLGAIQSGLTDAGALILRIITDARSVGSDKPPEADVYGVKRPKFLDRMSVDDGDNRSH